MFLIFLVFVIRLAFGLVVFSIKRVSLKAHSAMIFITGWTTVWEWLSWNTLIGAELADILCWFGKVKINLPPRNTQKLPMVSHRSALCCCCTMLCVLLSTSHATWKIRTDLVTLVGFWRRFNFFLLPIFISYCFAKIEFSIKAKNEAREFQH